MGLGIDTSGSSVQFEDNLTPADALSFLSAKLGLSSGSREFAEALDAEDPVRNLRDEFLFPKKDGKDMVYFVGNSLGLQPRRCAAFIQAELDSWSSRGVNGHFEGSMPWLNYDDLLIGEQARIVGALPSEVAVMNSLTVNLHLLLIRFFNQATTAGFKRTKILIESRSFPSDFYALESQLRMRGLDPAECIVEVKPRQPGSHRLETADIIDQINEVGDELALLLFSGVQFYTGQLFDIEAITDAVHYVGAFAVWDLAHAAGNVDLRLHEWKVDGACWCSYKYLNSGPGGIGGFFVHQRHFNYPEADRLSGWWSHEKSTRFDMTNVYDPSEGASEFRLSNVPILSSAALLSSLEVFGKTSMEVLRCKSILLTGLLEYLLVGLKDKISEEFQFEIITSERRGAQLSLLFRSDEKANLINKELERMGVMVDYRKPGLVRAAPAPLYCRFADVVTFRDQLLRTICELEQYTRTRHS